MQTALEQQLGAPERALLVHAGRLAADLGVRLYAAGGSVRDLVLARPHDDWDLVVEGDGLGFAAALAQQQGGRLVIHERFQTASLRLAGGVCLDIAMARSESYARPGALPVVRPAAIADDLWRRDFSVNAIALALDPAQWGSVLDPTAGMADIAAGAVRALHHRSFWDDATRIVRAIGFEQRLGFAIEPTTEEWIRQAVRGGALHTVSSERLGEAILPLLGNSIGPDALRRATELGVTRALGARAAFTRRALQALDELPLALDLFDQAHDPRSRTVGCLAALLLGRGVEAEQVIDRLHLDRPAARELRGAQRLLRQWPRGFVAAARPGDLWDQLREAGFGAIIALWLATRESRSRAALVRYWRELAGTGPDIAAGDLRALGYRPGPGFGRAIQAAIRAKLDHAADRAEQLSVAAEALRRDEER